MTERLLVQFVEMTRETLGQNAVGVYLHGSAVMGCFNPEKSDLDLLIVVDREPSDEEKRAFLDGVLALNTQAPAKGLELSVLKREHCNPFVHPAPFDFHFSNAHLKWATEDPQGYIRTMKGMDPDLAAHVTILNHRGRCIWGLPVGDVFGNVRREDYIDAIWYDVENAVEDVKKDPMYITLNLCRVLAFLRDGLILSKKAGGQWGLGADPQYAHLLESALRCYGTGQKMESSPEAEGFVRKILEEIRGYL